MGFAPSLQVGVIYSYIFKMRPERDGHQSGYRHDWQRPCQHVVKRRQLGRFEFVIIVVEQTLDNGGLIASGEDQRPIFFTGEGDANFMFRQQRRFAPFLPELRRAPKHLMAERFRRSLLLNRLGQLQTPP
jgi:hypothetical protein